MKAMTITEITGAVKGKLVQGDPMRKISGVSIDSRTIDKGQLFIAIIGEQLDGHRYIQHAVDNGAGAVIAQSQTELSGELPLIMVDNTTTALQDLASYYRQKFVQLPVVGITGSAGKTSTKDMIAALLSKSFRVAKTQGNLNNYYGLPLTILQLTGDEEIAVLEMGMSNLGEIDLLARIARPRIGVITNVGAAHLENLGTIENVARAKSELIKALPTDGVAILNYDNIYVRNMEKVFKGQKIIFYGLTEQAQLYPDELVLDHATGTSFTVNYQQERVSLVLNKPGQHNLYNALAAIAVAREFKVGWPEIKTALQQVEFSNLRWEIKELGDNIVLINDTYNANPLSMQAALHTARNIAPGRVIAVLGAMLELGQLEERAHRELGQFICEQKIDLLISVGPLGALIAQGAVEAGMEASRVFTRENNQQASQLLLELLEKDDTVLIKGSRGNKMEEIVEVVLGRED